MSQNLSSAAVVIGALRVKFSNPSTGRYIDLEAGSVGDVLQGISIIHRNTVAFYSLIIQKKKTCVKRQLKIDKNKHLNDNW